ncbi:MAG: hypothetical protein ACJ779_08265 [Chloroflexota bacterium]
MNVPRPLLVVVVVIVILGITSCGAGVVRGRLDAAGPTAAPTTLFRGLSDEPVPRRDVRIDALDGGSCNESGTPVTVTVATHCLMTVDPRSLRPRTLRLDAVGPPIFVVVGQEIRGERHTKDKLFPVSGVIEVSVAGTTPVTVDVSCSCTLTFPG